MSSAASWIICTSTQGSRQHEAHEGMLRMGSGESSEKGRSVLRMEQFTRGVTSKLLVGVHSFFFHIFAKDRILPYRGAALTALCPLTPFSLADTNLS
jgi:hypothetical protein